MSEKKFLFLVDHKHRDLPSLSLIAYFLNKSGCIAKLVGIGFEDDLISQFDPDFVVLPKPVYDFKKLIEWKILGRKIIVVESEGNPQDIAYKIRIRVAPELFCFWSEEIKERYRNQLEKSGTKLEVIGFHRSDLLHKKYLDLFPAKEELLTSYGLDPNKKTITIATSTQDSHFSDSRVSRKYKRRNRSLSETADYIEIVSNMRKLRDVTEKIIKIICSKFPEINLAIKPHPNENTVYWNEFINEIGAKNVALVVGQPINHLLKVSDLHIAHNVCTTTIESLMSEVPTMEIHTDKSKDLYQQEHLLMANYIVREPDMIIPVIKTVLLGDSNVVGIDSIMNDSDIAQYVRRYFYKFDGERCYEYAKLLNQYAGQEPRIQNNWFKWLVVNPKLYLLYSMVSLRSALRKAATFSKYENIEKEVNAPTNSNDRDVCEIEGVLVDKEYGLYDNRMKAGDEILWYDRFSKHTYIAELLRKS